MRYFLLIKYLNFLQLLNVILVIRHKLRIEYNRIEELDLKEYFIASSTLIINQFNNQFIFINRFT